MTKKEKLKLCKDTNDVLDELLLRCIETSENISCVWHEMDPEKAEELDNVFPMSMMGKIMWAKKMLLTGTPLEYLVADARGMIE